MLPMNIFIQAINGENLLVAKTGFPTVLSTVLLSLSNNFYDNKKCNYNI
jgi:hypothetical protein